MFPSLWVHSVFSGLAKNTHLLSVVTAGGGMHVDNQAVDAKKKKKVITHSSISWYSIHTLQNNESGGHIVK